MKNSIYYLFDPLCGWCYGATPSVSILAEKVPVKLLPTGIFAGAHRKMDASFAEYAWRNDQRIAHLTGQVFSDRHRKQVLQNKEQFLDSGPATLALTAVALTEPAKELAALKMIQRLRYVDGRDVTATEELSGVLRSMGLEAAAKMFEARGEELLQANRARIEEARAMMLHFDTDGVPAFILEKGGKRRVLDSGNFFTNPHKLIHQLTEE